MHAPTTLPVVGSMVITGFVLLVWPSLVISTTIRGSTELEGNV